jgi:hypothetical protein
MNGKKKYETSKTLEDGIRPVKTGIARRKNVLIQK